MDESVRIVRCGDPNGLFLELRWLDREPRARAWGALTVRIAGVPVWATERLAGVEWTWLELLEHLALAWKYIAHDQTYPAGKPPFSPIKLSDDSFLKKLGGDSRELYVFQRRHDLATGLEGLYLPSLWITRQGQDCWVASPGQGGRQRVNQLLPLVDVLDALRGIGDAIAARVRSEPHPRAVEATRAWLGREPTEAELVAFYVVDASGFEDVGPDYWESPGGYDESPMMAAARLTSRMSSAVRREVVDWVRDVPQRETPQLDRLSEAAASQLFAARLRPPHEQGQTIAQWLRAHLGKADNEPVSPEATLRRWGVHVDAAHLDDASLDAIAVWGEQRGPAVLINTNGSHASGKAGRRTTLAHEMAHLLLDRGRSLPVAEVLGGLSPVMLEKRANAFAAEFLAPQAAVARWLSHAEDRVEALEEMKAHFDASQPVIGWQVKNGPGRHFIDSALSRRLALWTRPWREGQLLES